MDDLLTGAGTVKDASLLKNELEHVLSGAGFILRKWISNKPQVFQDSNINLNDVNYIITDDEKIKTLGMSWNSNHDHFYFSLDNNLVQNSNVVWSKRTILSIIARVYDPLGLISCVTVTAKCMLQTLWKNNIGWDDPLPDELNISWHNYFSQLHLLNNLKIPRQITSKDASYVQLHGYCDSSEKAYGAVLYLRSLNSFGETIVRMISAKSRVAPVKSLILPKLVLYYWPS